LEHALQACSSCFVVQERAGKELNAALQLAVRRMKMRQRRQADASISIAASFLSRAVIICLLTIGASVGPHAADVAISSTSSQAVPHPPPEPDGYRTDHYRSPVPLTLKGARVLTDREAMKIWSAKSAIFIDVYPHPPKPPNLPAGTLWRETTHQSIENAVWLPNVGYGVLSQASDAYFRRNLENLTHGDKAKQLVFFCLRNCWMSWNAAKRALSYGYTNVDWYRDGTDGWQEAGGLIDDVRPLP
jgi:PQQ-dependent catabolism-associated CXXCW motif protein